MEKEKNYAIILYKNSIEDSKGVAPPIFFKTRGKRKLYNNPWVDN